MSKKLLESISEYVTPDLVSKAGDLLGESQTGIAKTISAAIPTILGGLINKTGDSNAMGMIMNLISQSGGGSILSNLPSLLSGGEGDKSSSFLNLLFGSKVASITDFLSNVGGVKSSSVTALLGMIAPMILGHFAKTGTSSQGLTSLLSSEKSNILGALPSGLGSIFNFGDIKEKIADSFDQKSGGLPKWLLPLLLVLGALVALYFMTKSCNSDKDALKIENTVKAEVDTATDNMDAATTTAGSTMSDLAAKLGAFFKFKLPNGFELNVPKNGVENKIVTWMNDKTKVVDKTTWFNFDRLLFDTGKSTLTADSQEQLKNVAAIMKAYPTMEIKLGGYTDNTGNAAANLKLSDERAKSVMAELVKLGVGTTKIAAEGYGDQFPVADNSTEEGRSQNRRIGIRITKK